ncbi:hypothetical protein [Bradyrhizobium sp. Rc3b]|uniref:hypothetical protein n=1 Tax=Bradyrhizobium sp. Rc3b TaxID=1855322 RepID=UPI0011602321|nr:hypothetical protein [Bradyrhizobium sp. Rc3b]
MLVQQLTYVEADFCSGSEAAITQHAEIGQLRAKSDSAPITTAKQLAISSYKADQSSTPKSVNFQPDSSLAKE